jgi:hypothetical protein
LKRSLKPDQRSNNERDRYSVDDDQVLAAIEAAYAEVSLNLSFEHPRSNDMVGLGSGPTTVAQQKLLPSASERAGLSARFIGRAMLGLLFGLGVWVAQYVPMHLH